MSPSPINLQTRIFKGVCDSFSGAVLVSGAFLFGPRITQQGTSDIFPLNETPYKMALALRIIGWIGFTALMTANILALLMQHNDFNTTVLASINLSVAAIYTVGFVSFLPILKKIREARALQDRKARMTAFQVSFGFAVITHVALNVLMLYGISGFSMNNIAWSYTLTACGFVAINLMAAVAWNINDRSGGYGNNWKTQQLSLYLILFRSGFNHLRPDFSVRELSSIEKEYELT